MSHTYVRSVKVNSVLIFPQREHLFDQGQNRSTIFNQNSPVNIQVIYVETLTGFLTLSGVETQKIPEVLRKDQGKVSVSCGGRVFSKDRAQAVCCSLGDRRDAWKGFWEAKAKEPE